MKTVTIIMTFSPTDTLDRAEAAVHDDAHIDLVVIEGRDGEQIAIISLAFFDTAEIAMSAP